jgi:diguanylate cyclase (GGDEF)-like protein/PAS domain S-box-containing protein
MDFRFSELVDLDSLWGVMHSFYEATGIPHGIVDANNTVLCEIGWQDACSHYHRVHPVCAERCRQSNLEIVRDLRDGQFNSHCCQNGLMDYATPIVIEGELLATIFVGQLLHEPPDLAFFRRQAKDCGFDEAAYLEAIGKVPVISREKVEAMMDFYVRTARMLADQGLAARRVKLAEQKLAALNADLTQRVEQQTSELAEKNRRLEEDVAARRRTEEALRTEQDNLQALLDSSPVGIGWSRLDGTVEYVNRRFTELFGYTLADIPTVKDWYLRAYPDASVRRQVVEPWSRQVEQARRDGSRPLALEVPVTCKNGSICRVIANVSWVGERRLINFSDITESWKVGQRELARERILEKIAKGAPLAPLLEEIVRSIETEKPAALCSILLLDADGVHLRMGAAPRLPDDYNRAVDGVAIGDNVGSCGTAAYLRRRVVVTDIANDPRWAAYRDLSMAAGLRSCWSEPVFASDGRLLGTFAIYHREVCAPVAADIALIARAANLASIVIEHEQAQRELERQARTDFLTGLINRRYFVERAEAELLRSRRYAKALSLFMLDIDHFKRVNDRCGHKTGDLVLQQLAEVMRRVLREVDIIARIGGEEFAVLLPETGGARAAEVAERLRREVAASAMRTETEAPVSVTISIGVTTLADDSGSVDSLLRAADGALYAAKNSGRNRVCISSD